MANIQYDALVVLGAVMRWDASMKCWTFPLILEPEEYSGRLVLGEWRALAAAILQDSSPLILVTGGSNTHPETGEQCSRATELAKVIVDFGVPTNKVIPIGQIGASHTLGNAANLGEYLEAHQEIRQIGILSPRFQMLRAMVMHDKDPKFKRPELDIEWIEVETTLVANDQSFKMVVDQIYATEAAAECWRKEQDGLWKFLRGKYQVQKSA